MKLKLILIPVFCLIANNAYSQMNILEDVEHVKAVKGITKREIFRIEKGATVAYLSKITYYNDEGYEISSLEFNSKGDTTKSAFVQYFGSGLELTVDYEKNKVDSVYEKYNERNLLLYDVYILGPEHPGLQDSTIYTYDENGNLKTLNEVYWKYKEVYTYKDNKIVSVLATDGDVDEGEKPEVYVSETYKYLDGGRKIENKSWIGKNDFYGTTYYTLDKNGLTTLTEVYKKKDGGKLELTYKRVSTYYENGNLKHETIDNYDNNELKWGDVYTYSEEGLFTSQVHMDKIGITSTEEYKYYYK